MKDLSKDAARELRRQVWRRFEERYGGERTGEGSYVGPFLPADIPSDQVPGLLLAALEAVQFERERAQTIKASIDAARDAMEGAEGGDRYRAACKIIGLAAAGGGRPRLDHRAAAELYVALTCDGGPRLLQAAFLGCWGQVNAGHGAKLEEGASDRLMRGPLESWEALAIVAARLGYQSARALRDRLEENRPALVNCGLAYFQLPAKLSDPG